MNELMRDEILDQPQAIAATLESLRIELPPHLETSRWRRIIFTGSGDSHFASLALTYAARRHVPLTSGIWSYPAMDAARYWSFDRLDLLVAISISGETPRTVEAADVARAQGAFVLAITNKPSSSLCESSDTCLVLPFASRSRRTPHTTDYSATLMAIAVVIERLGGARIAELDEMPGVVGEALESLEMPCHRVGESLGQASVFQFLGSGPSLASAMYGAAKFWEAGGIRASAFDVEEVAHGPHLQVEHGDPVFVLAPREASLDRAVRISQGLGRLGAKTYAVTDRPEAFADCEEVLGIPTLAEVWSPFVTCLPMQWLCLSVANRRGMDVVRKTGNLANPEIYDQVQKGWLSKGDPEAGYTEPPS
jgi:glucosamine 6-phosphate synthetase-like amidotransferase/phosphosugar isomerase protein